MLVVGRTKAFHALSWQHVVERGGVLKWLARQAISFDIGLHACCNALISFNELPLMKVAACSQIRSRCNLLPRQTE
jgi:hypothetical protein